MSSTRVRYIASSQDSEQAKSSSTDLQIVYLRATVAILTLTLATVSAILVWKLVASKNNCEVGVTESQTSKQDHKQTNSIYSSSYTQTPNRKECSGIIVKKPLPYILPNAVHEAFDEAKKNLAKEVQEGTLVSVSCSAVYRDKTLWHAGYGVLDKSTHENPNEDSLYRTGSLVKLLTTLVTFKLLEEKKLDCLDDPLNKYFSRFSVKNPFNENVITIRQILSHTSGLPREVPCGSSFSSNHDHNVCPVNTTYVLESLKNTNLKFAPGTFVGYSNLGYSILAHALYERFGGRFRDWQQWISYELLYPLGMTRTALKNDRFRSNVASNYKANGVPASSVDWGWSSPSLQMSTSTADLAKLMLAILNSDTTFIRKEMTRKMFKPEFVFPDMHTIFSPGWQIRYHNGIRVVTKAGAVPGSSAAMILMPEQRFGFVLLATGQEIASRLAEEISKKLSKTFAINLVSKSLEIRQSGDLKRYTGLYILRNNWSDKVKATISVEQFTGRLMLNQDPGYPVFVYLSFKKPRVFQIIYPHGLSCEVYALGQNKEDVTFKHLDHRGRFKQFMLGSFVFQRIS